jgi:hypothetical protein
VDGKISALVWTGKSEDAGLYVYSSADGASWKRESRLGGVWAKHADMASNGSRLGVVWDEEGKIYGATSGSWGRPKPLAPAGSHPRIVPVKDGFRVFWNEKDRVGEAAL